MACNLGYSRMQGIRRRSKERGSNTIAWTEEIIVGSNDAAETWNWKHEAQGSRAVFGRLF